MSVILEEVILGLQTRRDQILGTDTIIKVKLISIHFYLRKFLKTTMWVYSTEEWIPQTLEVTAKVIKLLIFSKAWTPERKNSDNKIITIKYPNEVDMDETLLKQQENENNEILMQIRELSK